VRLRDWRATRIQTAGMRYPDGGGLTAQDRPRREQMRLQAATMFAQDADARQVAQSLRVGTKSVYQWSARRRPLASKGTDGNARSMLVE
jgi:hypothetical protein